MRKRCSEGYELNGTYLFSTVFIFHQGMLVCPVSYTLHQRDTAAASMQHQSCVSSMSCTSSQPSITCACPFCPQAYEIYIAQVKTEQADLEHEGGKPTVPPKIKQPQASKSRTSPSSSPSPNRRSQHDDPSYSSSYEGTDSNQTSPALSEGMGG